MSLAVENCKESNPLNTPCRKHLGPPCDQQRTFTGMPVRSITCCIMLRYAIPSLAVLTNMLDDVAVSGITLAVLAGVFLVLGIAELCLPHFVTAGGILYVPILLTVPACLAILAGWCHNIYMFSIVITDHVTQLLPPLFLFALQINHISL